MFRREEGGGPDRRRRTGRTVARRPVTVKVSVLKQDKDTYSSPMDIAVTCTIVVPYNLDPAQFLQALREKVPNSHHNLTSAGWLDTIEHLLPSPPFVQARYDPCLGSVESVYSAKGR
ncbi:rRNA adenine N-6-methyltransferase [Dissostichus eleginoides]|uniref:rRNA adenine N-6-methyltransferase n=1 Tax=Dissostichus eleginoides TaxID=100907 RepID=A0AAD9ERY8_DISEL|nr:rRNA adenine N-6-methyltransferase [Dissostichus eleginoides]